MSGPLIPDVRHAIAELVRGLPDERLLELVRDRLEDDVLGLEIAVEASAFPRPARRDRLVRQWREQRRSRKRRLRERHRRQLATIGYRSAPYPIELQDLGPLADQSRPLPLPALREELERAIHQALTMAGGAAGIGLLQVDLGRRPRRVSLESYLKGLPRGALTWGERAELDGLLGFEALDELGESLAATQDAARASLLGVLQARREQLEPIALSPDWQPVGVLWPAEPERRAPPRILSAPSAPSPRATPAAPVHLKAIPVGELVSPGQRFKCVPFSAVLKAKDCIQRQEIVSKPAVGVNARAAEHRALKGRYSRCGGCDLGLEVAAQIGGLS